MFLCHRFWGLIWKHFLRCSDSYRSGRKYASNLQYISVKIQVDLLPLPPLMQWSMSSVGLAGSRLIIAIAVWAQRHERPSVAGGYWSSLTSPWEAWNPVGVQMRHSIADTFGAERVFFVGPYASQLCWLYVFASMYFVGLRAASVQLSWFARTTQAGPG